MSIALIECISDGVVDVRRPDLLGVGRGSGRRA
jgi:hypothetical protein